MGEKYTLEEIREAVRNYEDMQNLNSDDEEKFLEMLKDSRKVKTQGARANNKAAALDASAVMASMQAEVCRVHWKTHIFLTDDSCCRCITSVTAQG